MSFSHKYNTDDVIIRASIVGLVNLLNNKINFYNVWSDTRRDLVRVPFFYAMSGDERFLQDYFSNWNDCVPDFIEGNTDPIPRGMVQWGGMNVLSSNLTSRYVRGYYTKEVDGELKRFNSYINSIPLQMNFTCEIMADTDIDSMKIIQSIISVFYRTQVYSINFMGFRVPTQVGFPDNYSTTKLFEYTYGTTERLRVPFELELQTYLPLVDPKEEFFAGTNISSFSSSTTVGSTASPVPDTTGSTVSSDTSVGVTGATGDQANYLFPGSGAETQGDNREGGNGGDHRDDTSRFSGDYWE